MSTISIAISDELKRRQHVAYMQQPLNISPRASQLIAQKNDVTKTSMLTAAVKV